jgi:hypothetical protein
MDVKNTILAGGGIDYPAAFQKKIRQPFVHG